MKYKNKYLLAVQDGRNEPIKDLEHAKRIVIIDRERVGAEDITFAYCCFDPKMSFHKKHIHEKSEEIMYIISGKGHGGVADQEFEMKKGDTVWVPRGAVHWFCNPFDEPCEMLFLYTRPTLQSAGYQVIE
jgi:mannose-6-phosphate isomerase-like protein (cupin superfamily)